MIDFILYFVNPKMKTPQYFDEKESHLRFICFIIAAANVVIQTKKKTLGRGERCPSGCFFTYVKRD